MLNYKNYDDVVEQLREAGLDLDLPLKVATGSKSVRCKIEGGDREKRGWYRLHEWIMDNGDAMLVGSFGIFQGDDPGTRKVELTKRCVACGREMALAEKSCPSCGSKEIQRRVMSDEQKAALKEKQAQDRKRAEAERKAEIEQAAQWAGEVWKHCRELEPGGHDYLVRKKLAGTGGVRVFESNDGLRLIGAEADDYTYLANFHGALVVPMMNTAGKIFGLQFILDRTRHQARIERTGRDKDYWPAGLSKDAHYWLIGGTPRDVVLEAEGYATAMSLHNATGLPVVVAFDAGNLPKVAKALRQAYRRVRILGCADDDHLQKCAECKTYTLVETPVCTHCGKPHRKANAGKQRAQEAALLVDGAWLAPIFAEQRPLDRKGPTDFNDLHVLEGVSAVRSQIEVKLRDLGWITPSPADSPRDAGGDAQGGGGRRAAVSVMTLDDLVERFIYVDDVTGEFVFDTWTSEVCKFTKMVKLLPAGVRVEQLKTHHIWTSRAVYIDQIGFDPGGDDKNVICNRWRGWPTRPKSGRCDALLDLLRFICSNEPSIAEQVFDWVLKWLAYPIQHPGAKMQTAIVVHGPQGTGKSRFFEAYSKIFGEYSIVINQGAIEDKFNSDWSERKLFVLADEIVARSDMYHLKNQLKNFITGEWVRVNPKNVAAHKERNHMNIVFTSNEKMPVVLEDDDRRHCIIWTPPKMNEVFYNEVSEEIANGGIEALHDYLLSLDLGDFKPWTKPPMTDAKRSLITLSLGSDEIFLREWQDGHIETLPFGPAGTSTVYAEYLAFCKREGETHPRPAKHFWSAAAKPGWEIGRPDRYVRFDSADTVSWRCVIPPDELLRKVKIKPGTTGPWKGDTESKTRWLTRCYFDLENARLKSGDGQ
jgi:putative DNA primase/helicase